MKLIEYGREHSETMIFLHGGGLSWWSYRDAALLLSSRYHVVLPILDGHAGSGVPFSTIEDCANRLISYIDTQFGGQVLLIGGLSLGGQVLTEMLSCRKDICQFAVIESALVFPMPITAALIRPAYSLCYPLIRQRWFSKLQFSYLGIKQDLFELYFADSSSISLPDLTAFLSANSRYSLKSSLSACHATALILAGKRELPIIKRSAHAISQCMPHAQLRILQGMRHGAYSINHAEQYVEAILALIGD